MHFYNENGYEISKELYKENGTVFGDLSAILIDNMPFWAEFSSTPSSKVSLMSNWEEKMEAIVNETIHENLFLIVDELSSI